MHLVYLDEVKFQEGQQPYYWLCGLAISDEKITAVETTLAELAEDYFGSRILRLETEFHASHIVHGKGPYKGAPIDERVALFERLVDIVDENDLGRIVVRLDPTRIARTDIEAIAFMYFIERVDGLMQRYRSKALLIADHEKDLVTMNVRNLSNFKVDGTDFEYGREIAHVADTVHHTHSHHSRLIGTKGARLDLLNTVTAEPLPKFEPGPLAHFRLCINADSQNGGRPDVCQGPRRHNESQAYGQRRYRGERHRCRH